MIVYAKFNDSRRREFQLDTVFEEKNGVLIVSKRPSYPESREFLYSLLDKCENLSKAGLPLTLVKAYRSDSDTISFEYTGKDSFQTKMLRSLRKGKAEDLISQLKSYSQLVDDIPSIRQIPGKEFEKIFGPGPEQEVLCTAIGCLDLNFDNIFIEADKPILIDYEWTFNFPLPRDYIVFRAIFGFYRNFRSYLPNAICSLEEALTHCGVNTQDVEQFLSYEAHFQNYVAGTDKTSAEDLYDEYELAGSDERIAGTGERLSALQSYCSMLEDENNKKNDWILKIENGIKEKDQWMLTLEKNHSELSAAVIGLDGRLTALQAEKSPGPADAETVKLREYVSELETISKLKSAEIENLEQTVKLRNEAVRKYEQQVLELSGDLRALNVKLQQLGRNLKTS